MKFSNRSDKETIKKLYLFCYIVCHYVWYSLERPDRDTFQHGFQTRLFNFPFNLAYNCAEMYKSGERKDGVYTIKPDNLPAFDVFCDQTTAGGGWTVFQKRLNGSVDFYLYWNDYKIGFGDLNGEVWLGLHKIHRLTSDDNSMLRVDLEDFEANTAYAEYNKFGVKNESDLYRLNLGLYSGMKFFVVLSWL